MQAVLERLADAAERQAAAAEGLTEIAKDERLVMVEPGPSICPNCGTPNPVVTPLADNGGSGKVDSFVLIAETHCCNRTVYGIPREWALVLTEGEVRMLADTKGGTDNDR